MSKSRQIKLIPTGNKDASGAKKRSYLEKKVQQHCTVAARYLQRILESLHSMAVIIDNTLHFASYNKALQAEEALRQSEKNFRLLADAMPQIVWTTLADGRLDYSNQRWFEYTGQPLEDAQGWGWQMIIHPEDLQRCTNTWIQALESGSPYQVEYRIRRGSDGTYRWHLARALPIKDDHGNVVKWYGTSTNIHDCKAAEERLAQLLHSEQAARAESETLNKQLAQVNKTQSDFISIVSHEFRTTLTSILGFSELLSKEDFTPGEIKDYTKDINTDARRLTRLINDLLDLERMKSGKMTLKLEAVNINMVLQEVAERYRSTTTHDIQLHLDNHLPFIQGDQDKLIQVVTNLVSNAIKYSPDGKEIILSSLRSTTDIHVSVQDHGVGIPQDAQEEIFAPYSRVDLQRTRYIRGTGLGLAIVRQIITMHNGQIWVESTLGEGSTFHFTLPITGPCCTPEQQPLSSV